MTFSDLSGADFSHDRQYRRRLWRRWDLSLPILNMIMLNPSVANETGSDPTVTRQIERAKRLGCGSLIVTNAFDLVATDPKDMKQHPRPSTVENDQAIFDAATETNASNGIVIAAWGPHASHRGRHAAVLDLLCSVDGPLHALRVTAGGFPGHPLYLPYSVVPFRYP